ncbi:hypothetical protein [Schleiferilactobacillus perolens]|jgi:hypothetical protein|uniref:hypothetical protein n=1 Tax=Schleiferilactobacillus perolens TaxID=100468 RepID=UPI0023564BE2|nr:hypothetical protein [Schleiferilactobacillus perolens]MCI2171936.1 hypothetical protein [Schleiferilactobacillus perolens]
MSKSKSKQYADRIMPILSEEEILANFTDEELRQVGLNMGYKIPQGTKFHAEQSNQKSSE